VKLAKTQTFKNMSTTANLASQNMVDTGSNSIVVKVLEAIPGKTLDV
jgi:hypothetical protein